MGINNNDCYYYNDINFKCFVTNCKNQSKCTINKLKEQIKNKIMENKELNIVAPDGYEIDKENSTFEKIVFKKINELPKTWEDLKYISGAYISALSYIDTINSIETIPSAKNIFPTKELADAALALAQLLQLRDRYNGDNKGFMVGKNNYCITVSNNSICKYCDNYTQRILAFRTRELRDEFYNNFKDLIEIAKPLL